ncbi:UDP-2,4-diacetamido-2,4,6-trideoxy-beta-L-altropyranose hydrolase [Selenomonas artemidis]|jgi:pseudaminic acid biosynthesis-associated protein pseG|uniref:UDP-2,4-diacetamido-2,4, 6-trideoxy-beta-L-altropyranose hydrolase n=1 Tax=Selenomonas artemidis TaxID=671224 RepID=UPI0023EFFDA4|nr:UDP-2,4-diacetamido-2,4,6-trideoxy-beta-L-altropyranose hydrolase [Selenomonas artemidis]
MNVAFRVDSSIQIGSGHLMRCLTLAERLHKRENASILFVVRDLEGALIDLIRLQGYSVLVLPHAADQRKDLSGYEAWLTVDQETDALETAMILRGEAWIDFLIIDSYAIDERWERKIRPYVGQIAVIDDLANRVHDCDILLDQNFYSDKDVRYQGLVPESCRCFLGPQYVLLRQEFYDVGLRLRKRTGIETILVFYGGVDLTNETEKAIFAIQKSGITAHVDVIVGQGNPHKEKIRKLCNQYENMMYHCQVSNIGDYMNAADISLGGGGTATWERCFLGLPTLVTSIADNQTASCIACGEAGYIWYLGIAREVQEETIIQALQRVGDPDVLTAFQHRCRLNISGEAGTRPTNALERCFLAE